MTAVGTSVATMAGSILSTLGDNGATRSSGAGSSADGGFEALFSRTIEADDSSAVAGDRADTAAASLDRRAGADRQRDVVADDRRSTRVDEPTDRVTDSSDRAARADTTDEPDDVERPARAAGDSNDPSAVAAPLVIVAPLAVQTPPSTSSDVVPSLVPATVTAATPVDAAGAQTVATTETVAPGAPGTTTAPASPSPEAPVATGVPATDASPTTIEALEALEAAVGEQMPTPLEAVAQPTSSDAPVGQQPSMASPGASPADALSAAGQPMAPVAESAASTMPGVVPTSTAQSTVQSIAQAAVVADVGHDADGIDSARPGASPTTAVVDGSSTTTGTGTGATTPGAGTASGTAAPTDPAVSTTATPERVTELRRMRDRAALGGVAGGAMSVDLSDEGLGPLTLHALQNASGVHLTLDAADQATRDLLSRQGAALRTELEAGGTTLGSLDIQHSGPGSSGERGAGTPSGRADRMGAPRSLLAGSATTPLATVRSRPTPSTDGVDLLI